MSNTPPEASAAGCAPTEPVSRPADAGAEPATPALRPGERIGFYQIEECLGAGGMGVVYRALDTQLGRPVALKLLSPHLEQDHDLLARFRGEAQIQARLTGRHIVTLHTILQSASGLVLVMEYVEGRTLGRQLARHGPLSTAQALRVFDHALRGVAQAHRLGIVHCDLKPGNIFLTRDGEVKLMDFGLAHLIEGRRLSAPHLMFGTLRYMAPEQIEGQGANLRSDLYALGVSLYEAVTGRVPFASEDPKALLHAHLHETPPPPSSLVPGLPPPLEVIIQTAMARRPEHRYPSADEMRMAILSLRRQLATRPEPPSHRTLAGAFVQAGVLPQAASTPPFTYGRKRLADSATPRPAVAMRRRHPLWRGLMLYLVLPAALLGTLSLALDATTTDDPGGWLARLRLLIRQLAG